MLCDCGWSVTRRGDSICGKLCVLVLSQKLQIRFVPFKLLHWQTPLHHTFTSGCDQHELFEIRIFGMGSERMPKFTDHNIFAVFHSSSHNTHIPNSMGDVVGKRRAGCPDVPHFHVQKRHIPHISAAKEPTIIQPSLDVSLEAKALEFLKSVHPLNQQSADAFLRRLASSSEKYLTDFIQPMMVLISSPSQAISTAAVKMLECLIIFCSLKIRLALITADMIPQLVINLNPLSLSFAEAVDIYTCLFSIIIRSFRLSTPLGLTVLGIEALNEQKAVHETVLKQVLVPSEKYI
ncbi:hypothetical protein BLNAU_21145 [Blattamonas nauphoetae]|uniref:Symplekin/Pta1 N-terminal domain-containing protein n=1 Tax=Blattamonas nauphoetae TaxID=2049346 RepID=A0ABQ9WWS7_9EUKA|nr:hypothetical protein BLNAU_21145 [Blattamonas nauphoetae]